MHRMMDKVNKVKSNMKEVRKISSLSTKKDEVKEMVVEIVDDKLKEFKENTLDQMQQFRPPVDTRS